MYREHFGLAIAPFGISPRLDFLYRSAAFEESMAHLLYGLENSEAVVLITGAIGTGKTMAIQSFLAQLGDRFRTALVTNTRVDSKELLKLVLEDLGHPPGGGADKSDLLIAFKQLLIESVRDGRRVVVVIDEAQNLDRDVLEEIRLLTNLGQGDEQPVQVVLVGQPELETHVEQPELAQLRQRIRVHCRLSPLSRDELVGYVDRRIEVAGGLPGLFTSQAMDRIYAMSGGVPRVVNTLCSDALLSAFVAGRRRIEVEDVGERQVAVAASDTRQTEVDHSASAPRDVPAAESEPRAARKMQRTGMAVKRVGRKRSTRLGGRLWWVFGVILLVAAMLAMAGRWQPIRDLTVRRAAPSGDGSPMSADQLEAGHPQVGNPGAVRVVSGQQLEAIPTTAPDLAVGAEPVPVDSSMMAGLSAPAADSNTSRRPDPVAEPAPTSSDEYGATSKVVGAPIGQMEMTEGSDQRATNDWYIHVSSFRTAPHATSVADGFGRDGISAIVREQVVRNVTWHRVYLGPFATRDLAVRRAVEMRDAGSITYYKVQQMAPGGGS